MTAIRCWVLAIVIFTTLIGPHPADAGTFPAASTDATVEVSSSIPRPAVTLGEPAYVLFSARNKSTQDTTINLGKNFTTGFRFTITKPEGAEIQAPVVGAHGMGAVGRVVVGAGKSYNRLLLINEWYRFVRPGKYQIQVKLLETPLMEPETVTNIWRSTRMKLTVLHRDPKRLNAVCQRLLRRALAASDLEAASQAALALSYVEDPVALPYLGQLLGANSDLSPTAIRGLVRISTPEAARVLESHLATAQGNLGVLIQEGIKEIKTGVHPTIMDSAHGWHS
ncbi:MAG: hypothetical protein ACRD2O_03615 [Terriglobia bacterium]